MKTRGRPSSGSEHDSCESYMHTRLLMALTEPVNILNTVFKMIEEERAPGRGIGSSCTKIETDRTFILMTTFWLVCQLLLTSFIKLARLMAIPMAIFCKRIRLVERNPNSRRVGFFFFFFLRLQNQRPTSQTLPLWRVQPIPRFIVLKTDETRRD